MKNIALILILVLLSSCLGTKKTVENKNDKTSVEKSENTSSTKTETETSKPITDQIIINVPESDNVEVMQMFEKLLRNLNTSKTSGSNSYSLRFDEELRQLVADIQIAQTKNEKVSELNSSVSEKSFDQTVSETSVKVVKLIPWWVWVLFGVVALPNIINALKLLINPLKAFIK